MNLVFIYGPPAVGKLTIAEELAKITNYKLFHNHLTQDLARELYPAHDEVRFGLVDKLRLATFEYAAQQNTDIIFTFVYAGEGDDDFVSKTVDLIKKHGGTVLFIELSAPDAVLLERVDNESRKRFHKLKDASVLNEQLKSKRFSKSVKQTNIFCLDSSKQNPLESAKLIQKYFKIRN